MNPGDSPHNNPGKPSARPGNSDCYKTVTQRRKREYLHLSWTAPNRATPMAVGERGASPRLELVASLIDRLCYLAAPGWSNCRDDPPVLMLDSDSRSPHTVANLVSQPRPGDDDWVGLNKKGEAAWQLYQSTRGQLRGCQDSHGEGARLPQPHCSTDPTIASNDGSPCLPWALQ